MKKDTNIPTKPIEQVIDKWATTREASLLKVTEAVEKHRAGKLNNTNLILAFGNAAGDLHRIFMEEKRERELNEN